MTTETRPAALRADDPHDRALLELVHPPDWVDPTPRGRYHLVVIGAGTGGLVTAAAAAGLGASVALIERELMGGDCLNVGCVPSKALLRAARGWAEARTGPPRFGADDARARAGGPPTAADFTAAMSRLRRLRARLAPIDSAARFRDLGVDVFLGQARFADPDTIEVGGKRLTFRRAVIASGGRAALPDVPGLADVAPLTNETVFALAERPAHLLVLGGGPIGCELAQAFARLGSAVTLVEGGPRLLPRDDPDAAAAVLRALQRDGVEVLLGARVARASRDADGARVLHLQGGGERALRGDQLLVAAGRAPNVEGLGLEAAGVRYTAKGVEVDDHLRTSNARVYAVGDVCSPLKFTHAADFQARLVVQNTLFPGRARVSQLVVPWATYTSPEVAQVGLTAEAAQAAGTAVDVVTVPFHDVDRAILDDEEDGFVRVVLARGSDRILGATVVAAHAGELISEVTLAMTNGLGLGAIGKTIHPYPTQAEAFRKAADQWRRGKLTPLVRALFRAWFRATAG